MKIRICVIVAAGLMLLLSPYNYSTIPSFAQDTGRYFTAEDARVIEEEEFHSAFQVIDRIRRVAQEQGNDVWDPVVPSLVKRMLAELDLAPGVHVGGGKGEGGNGTLDILDIFNELGDVRTLPVYLKVMESRKVGSDGVRWAKSLLLMGRSVAPVVIKLLEDPSEATKIEIIQVLQAMKEYNQDYFTGEEVGSSRDHLVKNLTNDTNYLRRASVRALAVFGDSSTLPILQKVAATDPDTTGHPAFTIRVEATRAAKKLKGWLAWQKFQAETPQ